MISGCGAQSPVAPDRPAGPVAHGAAATQASSLSESSASTLSIDNIRTSYTVDLLKGRLSLSLSDGSTICGSYHGRATVPTVGTPRATLEGEITGGTGVFAGASGDLRGSGTGGLADNGKFSLSLRATVNTSDGRSRNVSVMLDGVSTATCTTTAPPRLALDGTGNDRGKDSAAAHLEHDLGDRICAVPVE